MNETAGSILERLVSALTAAGIEFTQSHHRAVFTSAEAAEVRGTSLHSGAKALILKGDEGFIMVVLPADLALNGKALRKQRGWRGLRFASAEEVLELTGLAPGSIPPFGSLFGLPTLCDERLAENESINFNAGSHTDSIQMTFRAYVAFESPVLSGVSKKT